MSLRSGEEQRLTELSYTFRANSASYLIPISFHAAELSWTTARHNAFCYL